MTADQAGDTVVLRYERPAAVLNKPVGDPSVRQLLGRRRAADARALRVYRITHPQQGQR